MSRSSDSASGRILDAVLVAGTGLVTLAGLIGATRVEDRTEVGVVGWLLAPALAAVLLFRRRAPIAVLVTSIVLLLVYYASGRPPVGLELPLAAAFFSAAEQGRMRTAGVIALLLIVGTAIIRVLLGQDPVILLALQVPTQLAVLGGAIGAGDAVHSRGQRAQQRAERSRLLAAERAAEARSLVEAERRALAREVHDVLGHSMVLIRLQAEVALDALDDHDQVRNSLTEIRATAQGGLADIRQSLQVLAPTEREPREPVATTMLLPDLVERMRAAGLTVAYAEEGTPQPMPIATDATAYRIVQEALTNVLKHAPGAQARVTCAYRPGVLEVCITDSGPFSGDFVTGAGITGLRERAAMIGGRLAAGADPDGAGFRVLAELPLGPSGGGDHDQVAPAGREEL